MQMHDGLDRASKLVEHYVRYVARRTRKIDSDDVRQELYLVYLRIQTVYEKQRGEFEHFLVKALKNRATDILRQCYGKREDLATNDSEDQEDVLEVAVQPTVDARLHLEDVLTRLSERQRRIVLAHIAPPKVLKQEWFARKLRAKHITCNKLRADCDASTAFSVVSETSGRVVLNDMGEIRRVLLGSGVAKSEQRAWAERLREAQCARHSVNNKHRENLLWRRQLVGSTIEPNW